MKMIKVMTICNLSGHGLKRQTGDLKFFPLMKNYRGVLKLKQEVGGRVG